jgi:thiol-disulfide isomerase/thioredoxin
MSRQFLGIQIDAVYHTSIVIENIEYYFGQGVQTCRAGATHHGQPLEIINLGRTDLPIEIVLEYLESLKAVYTPESYDLFAHNCNNFSNDFAMFLVGKGIPGHITSLPQTVLDTPFGQMLRPQIDAAMRPITQAPTPQPVAPARTQATNANTPNGSAHMPQPVAMDSALAAATGKVHNLTAIRDVDRLLDLAKDRSAIIFFTSSTCAPCKLVYQPYDDLAVEAGAKCVFIKIDFSHAEQSINTRYPNVRATPTFITYLRGEKRDEWSGADPRQLRNNVEMLLNAAFPPHPHLDTSTPILLRQSLRCITFSKVPPLEKLVAKMGDAGKEPAISSIVSFIDARERLGAMEAPLPQMPQFAEFLRKSTSTVPPQLLFTVLDLLRISLIDVRVAGFFAEEHKGATGTPATVHHLLSHVDSLGASAPYPLRLTTLHLACNLFTSPLFIPHLLSSPLSSLLISILTTALLDDKYPALKASALSLAMNIASSNHKIRMKKYSSNSTPSLPSEFELLESEQVELLASLLETLGAEEQWTENQKMALICTGWLVYGADMDGELKDMWKVMDSAGTVGKIQAKATEDRLLVKEIKSLLDAA